MSKGRKNFNGEGTFYYSEKLQRWVGQFTDPNTNKRKSVYDRDEKKCKTKLRKAISESENGKYMQTSNITVYQIGKEIIDLKHTANIIGDCAYIRNMETLKIIQNSKIGNLKIQKITSTQLQLFLNSLVNRSNSSITKVITVLKQIYSEAIKRNILIKNTMDNVIRPKSNKLDKKVDALTLEEHKLFVEALSAEKYKNIFLLAINTGMRCGEILALTPSDIDFKNKELHINKTITKDINDKPILKKSTKTYSGMRTFPIDSQLEIILKQSISQMKLNENNLIFTLDNCAIISASTLNTVFKRICKNLNFSEKSYNFHMLRHTFATRCIEAGMPAHVLQKLLGHSDISTTINTYTTIFNKFKENEFNKVIEYKKANNLL